MSWSDVKMFVQFAGLFYALAELAWMLLVLFIQDAAERAAEEPGGGWWAE